MAVSGNDTEVKKGSAKLSVGDVLLIVSAAAMFVPTFRRLAAYGWDAAEYDHAWFILPLFVFFLWHARGVLARETALPASAVFSFAAGTALFLFSSINHFVFLEAFSFCLVVWGLLRLKLNAASCRFLSLPMFLLLFIVPPPSLAIDLVTFPLKQVSIVGSKAVLSLAQIPVVSYGVVLQVGTHKMFIADACSGFRSIISLLALATAYLHFQPGSLKKKIWLLLAVVPIGILANIIRLSATGAIAWYFGHEKAEGFFHDFSGAVLFMFAIIFFILLLEVTRAAGAKKAA